MSEARKLAAILATDVGGYSRLTATDKSAPSWLPSLRTGPYQFGHLASRRTRREAYWRRHLDRIAQCC
jgi:hypothetical protein